jgi:hypothetical protein
MRALLACECDALDEAADAAANAFRLDARHPMVWVARARLAYARRDEPSADKALETATALGADPAIVKWIGRLGRTSARYNL